MMRTRTRRSGGPLEEALKYINVKDKEASFCVLQVAQKGRGVIITTSFAKGQFLLQYSGKLCTWKEGDALEEKLSSGFRFFFQFKGKKYCIDSTQEPSEGPMLGRLVNHGERQEINTKIVNFHDTPAMCLFALRDINKGEELLYDYGVTNLPWKKKHTFEHERIAVTEAEIQENQIDESEEESEETEEQSDLLQAKQTGTGTKHPLVSDESMTIRKKFKESPLTETANKFKTAVPSRPKKVPWSEEEQAAVKRHLGNFIAMQKLPGKEAIQATLKKERCLQKRNWRNVKDFVRNSITSRARKSGRGLCH
ncbi:uncharacterized protein [Apostichopus japonicus]